MLINSNEYLQIIGEIKSRIRKARRQAVLAANYELITLNWYIGKTINEHSAWGNKFIENLAGDIKFEFPNAKGYSVRNLKYMAKFARVYPDFEIVQTVSAQLSWSHNTALLDKVKDSSQRLWYARKAIEDGWSLNTLEYQIETCLYERQTKLEKTTNFNERLPDSQSELAGQILKDPYIFDFIDYRRDMIEREIETELIKNITRFLLELGTGFAFVGNQYHLEIEGCDFYIDLLFFNLKLHSYVVIELKNGDFKPEYAGKLNFYISAVDDILKTSQDNPTIGILLCKNKKGLIAEYALKDIEKPIGVSEFKLFENLPKEYENILPTAEDIERRINLFIEDEKQ